MDQRRQLEAAIATLLAKREFLSDAVIELALAPMREQLARMSAAPASASASGQQLRQVTALFLDIVGSTALSQHLDPEEVHALIDGVLARCTRVVQAHGGKVLQYAGDSLLAVFGAELSQEDDAERAVLCGLALREEGRVLGRQVRQELGQAGCHVRVGIHTGPALLGGGVDEDGSIRGQAVTVAARMEQTAPAGGLHISHDTWIQVRGVFEVQAQPPLALADRDEPLPSYLVLHAKPRAFRVALRGIDGVPTPMIGRTAEWQQLLGLLDATAASRQLHALTLVGDPGLGKSRLLRELQGALETHPQRFWLLLGRCHPQSRLQPYGLLRDLLAWRLQIADSDSGQVARAKLVDGLLPWLTRAAASGAAACETAEVAASAEAAAHRLGQLLGLDFSDSPHLQGLAPRQLRSDGFAALRDALQGLAHDGEALAMLLEDLHWADDDSLDFIAELIAQCPTLPLLLVASARPELLERRPAWGEGAALHQRRSLAALDVAQGQALARALLQRMDPADPEAAATLCQLLITEAEGNPFYMEELVRMLRDDGVIAARVQGDQEVWHLVPENLSALRVPGTLVGVLQARLDTLEATDRLALQQASIIGPVFWDDALAALDGAAPASLATLRAKALVLRHDRSAFEGTLEGAFTHHLLQQVTYDTVLKPARRAGHAAAARWLAERVGDRPAEYLAITAEHYARAGDPRRALDFFRRASDDAAQRFANQAALDYAQRALDNPEATDLRLRAHLLGTQVNMADLLGLRALQDLALHERAAVAQALGDESLAAGVLFSRALLASRRNDENEAFDLAQQASVLAERSGNHDVAAHALGQMGWTLYTRGRIDEALHHVQRALQRIRQALAIDSTASRHLIEIQTLVLLAMIEGGDGRLGRAEATAQEALALARQHGQRRPQVSILDVLGNMAMAAGRTQEAMAHYRKAQAAATEIGWTLFVVATQYNLASALFRLGQLDEADTLALQTQVLAQASELHLDYSRCLLVRLRVAIARDAHEQVQALIDEAQALFNRDDLPAFLCMLRACQADWHLRRGELPQALALAEPVAETALQADLPMVIATDDPLFPMLLCHRVWAAADDPRAAQALATAHERLLARAARAGDEAAQRGVLQDVPIHREIQSAWAAWTRRPA